MSDFVFDLIATSTFGMEAVVQRELAALGYSETSVGDGRVNFRGTAADICRTNLWLRTADRVLIRVGEFLAPNFGALFDQTKALPWPDLLPVDANFPVKGKSVKSQLHSVPRCQAVVKKAVVESLRVKYNRFHFEETGADFPIEISLLKDIATLTLDTSGDGLHKRGYRTKMGPAPLKETLAAGLLSLSFWKRDRPFVDPFCGSGTLAVEAALMARNIAPGMQRSFACEAWDFPGRKLWNEARAEARAQKAPRMDIPLVATDHDHHMVRMSRLHARNAGVESDIVFSKKELSEFSSKREYGCVVCNPPYGERLGDRPVVDAVCREIGRLSSENPTWSWFVLTSHPRFEHFFGRRANRRRKLYNGRIQCTYYQFHGARPPRASAEPAESPPVTQD